MAAGAPVAWSLEHGMIVRRLGAGPALVWIHGLGEWSVSFDPIARHAALAGFSHVLPDLPGYGRSPWPPDLSGGDSLERLADHLAAWLAPRPPAVLLGHSMGGVLATLVAERIPAAGVVDIDGNLSRGDCTFSAEAAAYAIDDFVARGFAELRTGVFTRGAADPALRGYHAALCAASPVAFHRNAADLVAASEPETHAARLAALRCPVLFVAGVPGGICAHSRGLLDRHGVRWAGIEPAGHWPFIDQPDAFAAAVRPFLDACAAA
jgi:pimeloyl-ACP methyl ester carboxylesterase